MLAPVILAGCGRPPSVVADASSSPDPVDRGADEPAEIQRLLDRRRADPDDGASRAVLARYYASRDPARARALLSELAAIPAWDHPLDHRAFAALADDPEVARIRELLAARAPKPAPSSIVLELDLVGIAPEGIAWDPRRRELLLGSMRQRSIIAVTLEGRTRVVIPAAQDGLLSVLGIDVDAGRDVLWAVSTAAPGMEGAPAPGGEAPAIFAFDLERGVTLGRWPSPLEDSLLNDVIALADGSAYVTDSTHGALLRRPVDAASGDLEVFLPASTFVGPNGLVGGVDGRSIYVADFDGIHRVDLVDRRHERLRPPAGVATLGGIDGLERSGSTLLGVQNVFDAGRVWAVELDASGRSITAARVIDANHPRYAGPTTGAIVDDRFLYLADAFVAVEGDAATPGRRHTILGLPLAVAAGE
ncbi:MAG: hypothetical protein R3B09_20475 [Nannocystaceae bacterium]